MNREPQPSPTITFYNPSDRQTIGNAMGSRKPKDEPKGTESSGILPPEK